MECIYNRLGRQSCLFTGIFRSDYTPPNGLCFDYRCADEPIMVSFNLYSQLNLFYILCIYLNVFKHLLMKVMEQII